MPATQKDIVFLLMTAGLLVTLVGLSLGKSLGLVNIGRTDYVTVTGTGYAIQDNRIASFSVGVTSINSEKAEAVREMNEKSSAILDAVRNFGISEEDIKTSNYSVFQDQTWDSYTQKTLFGDWRANTTIDVTLRDVEKADGLTTLLSTLQAESVYGPNFRVDNSASSSEEELIAEAIKDAELKAQTVAKLRGRNLGKMTNFLEGISGGGNQIFMRDGMGGGGGAELIPGSTELSKTVTVTFILL